MRWWLSSGGRNGEKFARWKLDRVLRGKRSCCFPLLLPSRCLSAKVQESFCIVSSLALLFSSWKWWPQVTETRRRRRRSTSRGRTSEILARDTFWRPKFVAEVCAPLPLGEQDKWPIVEPSGTAFWGHHNIQSQSQCWAPPRECLCNNCMQLCATVCNCMQVCCVRAGGKEWPKFGRTEEHTSHKLHTVNWAMDCVQCAVCSVRGRLSVAPRGAKDCCCCNTAGLCQESRKAAKQQQHGAYLLHLFIPKMANQNSNSCCSAGKRYELKKNESKRGHSAPEREPRTHSDQRAVANLSLKRRSQSLWQSLQQLDGRKHNSASWRRTRSLAERAKGNKVELSWRSPLVHWRASFSKFQPVSVPEGEP